MKNSVVVIGICIAIAAFTVLSCQHDDVIILQNIDNDSDGILDEDDNCPFLANPLQIDTDNDGMGDFCDVDDDNDGIPDDLDNCPLIPNPNQEDTDGDGITDACDEDDDNDGILDEEDNCPLNFNPIQADADGDGIGNACETDTFTPLAECVAGFADIFPCMGYDLMARVDIDDLNGAIEANDIWGWTDSTTGKEYAIVGATSNTTFVDVTNPIAPVVLGHLPTATINSGWRDIKVYRDHAYIVSEATDHGMQVFDLTRLRGVSSPQTFTVDFHYTNFGNCHNMVINEDSGFGYAVGTTNFAGGPEFIDLRNPGSPVLAGGYSGDNYSHDAQVVIYNGPDTEHFGKEIYIGSNEDKTVIIDVTDKSNPIQLSTLTYNLVSYTHQGWLTEDHKFFLLGDELDEVRHGVSTRTLILDVSDLDNPSVKFFNSGFSNAIDHNGYVKGNEFFLSSYTAGLRIYDVSDLENSLMPEIAFFDTHPASDATSFNGVWSVYPYLESGNILINDIEQGLFIVRRQ